MLAEGKVEKSWNFTSMSMTGLERERQNVTAMDTKKLSETAPSAWGPALCSARLQLLPETIALPFLRVRYY